MDAKKLDIILENHKHWLHEDCYGWETMRANLSFADLYGADLFCANLRGANLFCADLFGANLHCADLATLR